MQKDETSVTIDFFSLPKFSSFIVNSNVLLCNIFFLSTPIPHGKSMQSLFIWPRIYGKNLIYVKVYNI